MKYIISYDISNGKIRKEFSDFLKSEGFIRIQKSVFLGKINKKYMYKSLRTWTEKLDKVDDSIIIFPLCEEDFEESYFLGITFDIRDIEKFEEIFIMWGSMKVIIAYDIIENKIRNRVIEILLEEGLLRIQKSVFFGEINKKKIKRLVKRVEKTIDKGIDSLYFFKLCEKDFSKINYFGKNIEFHYFNKDFFIM